MTIKTNLHCVDASTRRGSSGVSLGSSIYAVYRIPFVRIQVVCNEKYDGEQKTFCNEWTK